MLRLNADLNLLIIAECVVTMNEPVKVSLLKPIIFIIQYNINACASL